MNDYTELIDWLRNGGCDDSPDCEHCPDSTRCELYMMNKAADAIEELSKKRDAACWGCKCSKIERNEWIPVTERLPEERELVIAYTPIDGYMFVGFHFNYKWGSNTISNWKIVTAMRSTKDITKKVTHWMPLPEPPKEET